MTAAKTDRTLMWLQHGPGSDLGKGIGRSGGQFFQLNVGHCYRPPSVKMHLSVVSE